MLHALDAVLRKDEIIQRRRVERVRPVDLKGALPVLVGRGELRNRSWASETKNRAKEAAVYAVILEILVHTDKVLITVAEIAGIENPGIDHRCGAGQVESVICCARARKNIVRRLRRSAGG